MTSKTNNLLNTSAVLREVDQESDWENSDLSDLGSDDELAGRQFLGDALDNAQALEDESAIDESLGSPQSPQPQSATVIQPQLTSTPNRGTSTSLLATQSVATLPHVGQSPTSYSTPSSSHQFSKQPGPIYE